MSANTEQDASGADNMAEALGGGAGEAGAQGAQSGPPVKIVLDDVYLTDLITADMVPAPLRGFYEAMIASDGMAMLSVLTLLLLVAAVANFVTKRILLRLIDRALRFTPIGRDDEIMRQGVIARLANIVPALVIMVGIQLVPGVPLWMTTVVGNVAAAFIILTVALAISAGLNVTNLLYIRRPGAYNKPIKGYLQVIKIAVFFLSAILMIAALIDKSPLILLSGLGAMAAVMLLVFQSTLLSLVASVQITSGDMLRVGDWIEMPELNADGDVIDIALHTVKVQNWDKTITTLPTRRLIDDPFKNWRGMTEAGGRRIKRALYLDQESIHFLTEDERAHLEQFTLLRDYLAEKSKELKEWNDALGDGRDYAINTRRLTNIGTFRAYIDQYLRAHPKVHQELTLMVRQLAPGPQGLPLEIYCFTNDTAWAVYEGVQADIFDHLYAILPEFGLRAFQVPSGRDLRKMGMGADADAA